MVKRIGAETNERQLNWEAAMKNVGKRNIMKGSPEKRHG